MYSIFTCQHMYLRSNAKERGLITHSAEGTIDVVASNDWKIQELHIAFDVDLVMGKPTQSDIDYIVDSMKHRPASVNLAAIRQFDATINFGQS